MPIPFLGSRRKRGRPGPPANKVSLPPDQLEFEDQQLRLQYRVMSSHGVRMPSTGDVNTLLPRLLEGFARDVELIEPVDAEFQDAAPHITRPAVALQWINAHRQRGPLARHTLFILESLDAIDLAYETFAVALLQGDVDGDGFPRFDAIAGGPVSFWDESSGDLVVRLVLAWGGEGIRGDTQRFAQRLLARLMANMLASQGATQLGHVERPVAVGGQLHPACPHCGFRQLDRRSHYCPKCGMRLMAG